ncbi:DUF262 domain-containing protein [Agromyces sp. LHK192]|uniref:DUF262 domain-containing protein n=1 Tax=Agromyces sp. LHK192 TaxID=2498704 RepID=UPI0013E30A87|nr:DUF262 domain-containing protein [Agromyces sp. LHK192]
MTHEQLDADPILVLDRFDDEIVLACPLFQRRFVWGERNIKQLFDDIDTVIDGAYTKRFLGALVFNNEAPTTSAAAGRYWIIDGQQRLTTLYLILVAVAEQASAMGEPGIELARDTFHTYLVSNKKNTKGVPKLRPTLVDSKQFETILNRAAVKCGIKGVQASPSLAVGDESGAMRQGYKVIMRCISDRLMSTRVSAEGAVSDFSTLETLRETILERLELVEIRLGLEHDPNEVFDRLNKEGERLGIIDLVRNEVLKHLDADPKAAQAAYSQEWKPFEDAFADDSSKAKYFFPFALTLSDSVTQATTFSTLSNDWKEITDDPVAEIVRRLRRHQSAYNAIHSARLQLIDEPVREQVRRLTALNRPSSVYPYVMQLLTATAEGDASTSDAAECLHVIESFLIRRAFCGIEPTGLHAIFKRLWNLAGSDARAVRAGIVSKTVTFPSDAQFEAAIRFGDLYHRKICSYVLEEYERAHTSGDILKSYPSITVDHVAPQERKGSWAASFTPEEHAELLHTWANLVPLSSEANSSKGTSSWIEAQSKLKLETVFSTTKHLYDSHVEWNADSVRQRGDVLVPWALARWPEFGDPADFSALETQGLTGQ